MLIKRLEIESYAERPTVEEHAERDSSAFAPLSDRYVRALPGRIGQSYCSPI